MHDYNNLPDTELVTEIKNSNMDAFKSIYFKYYELLFQFVAMKTNSAEFAEDVVQEAFTRIWDRRHKITITSSIKAYLFRIVNNLMINDYHKKMRDVSYRTERGEQHAPAFEERVYNYVDFAAAMKKLPEKTGTIFQLKYVQGLSNKEIAEIYNVSTKAIEKRVTKAFKILRKELI